MLIIRDQQLQALALETFEPWMVGHLEEFFPEDIAGLGPKTMSARIRVAVKQARQYGFVEDSQLCRYVDLTFILGPAFDQDPDLPWAAEILADRRVTDPEMRMGLLFGAAQDHVARTEETASGDEARA